MTDGNDRHRNEPGALDATLPVAYLGGVPQTGDIEPVSLPGETLSSSVTPSLRYEDFKPGITVKDWLLDKPLGEGGGGKVFACIHTQTQRRGAFKVVNLREGPHQEVQLSKLTFEVRTFNEKIHPNVVHCLDANLRQRPMWMVTEYIPGRPLDEVLEDNAGGLAVDVALHYAEQIGSGLAAVHVLGVVHRDLKPQNVLLREDTFQPVIIDFGESRFRQARTHTGSGKVFGSLGYTPPEMLMAGSDASGLADGRIDVFQLGVLLYEMLTGQGSPFRAGAANFSEVIVATLRQEPPSLEADVGPEVWAIIWRALRKHPDERFPTMADMVAAIRQERQRRGFVEDTNRTSLLSSMDGSLSLSASLPSTPSAMTHAQTQAQAPASYGVPMLQPAAAHAGQGASPSTSHVHTAPAATGTAPASGSSRMTLLAVLSVVMLLGVGGMAAFVMTTRSQEELPSTPPPPGKLDEPQPATSRLGIDEAETPTPTASATATAGASSMPSATAPLPRATSRANSPPAPRPLVQPRPRPPSQPPSGPKFKPDF